jgi:hypothetical protein
MDRATILRGGAALFAAAAFVGSGSYVVAHPKNDAAPLRTSPPSTTPAPRGTGRGTPPPRITAVPGVQATQLPGITFTHVS